MERTIYSKYSNERARKFCIRTDIVMDNAGEKKVYKHALFPEGREHIVSIENFCQRLNEAYGHERIEFCPCKLIGHEGENPSESVEFPFLAGVTLQEILEQAVCRRDEETIEQILKEFIRRLRAGGGEISFEVTESFELVFGALSEDSLSILQREHADVSAKISDIDMIFPNIFVDKEALSWETGWNVIDYEWTFDFPIPKGFLIYRGLYFAYYQVLHGTKWSIQQLMALADITEEQSRIYRKMEEHFQQYLSCETLPVRNMQRALGTRIFNVDELLCGQGCSRDAGGAGVQEAEWLRVRKIQYHIDREEYQDGSMVCSGWAFALTWDGRYLPVDIEVTEHEGKRIVAEITRRDRRDVALALKIKRVTKPEWGFDCVWVAQSGEDWQIQFSLGKKACIYKTQHR